MWKALSPFESGCQQRGTGGFGEIEHLPVHNSDDTAVTYYESNGIEALLNRIRPYYDENKEYWENGRRPDSPRRHLRIFGTGRTVETSIGILHKPEELATLYGAFRREVDPILEELGFRTRQLWLPTEIQLRRHSRQSEGPIQGDDRLPGTCRTVRSVHDALLRFDTGQHRLRFGTGRDIAKLRLGTAIGPILAWFFRNTPYFEGRRTSYPLLRQRMWDYLDFQRTNVIPGLFDPRFGWEDYAVDVLSTPMMFADLTHTPEVLAVPGTDLHHPAFYENANDVYPDRELNAYEINHAISTHFNDVRLKNPSSNSATGICWHGWPAPSGLLKSSARCSTIRRILDRLESYFRRHPRGGRVRGQGESAGAWTTSLPIRQFVGILAGVPGTRRRARRTNRAIRSIRTSSRLTGRGPVRWYAVPYGYRGRVLMFSW